MKKGLPAGFEYELLQRFAKEHGLWFEMSVADNEAEMLALVREGKVDLAITVSGDQDYPELVSTFPFYPAKNFIITGKSEKTLNALDDIKGRVLTLHSEKHQQRSIEYLVKKNLGISMFEPEPAIATTEFLQRVVDRDYDIAMISARDYIHAGSFHDDIKVLTTIGEQLQQEKKLRRWTVNKKNTGLKTEVDRFLKKEFQSEFYNIVFKRYYQERNTKQPVQIDISPYDQMVKKYAAKYEFDWRLVLAQMYQESQFKPDAVSVSGAKGLMQIMPATARELRVINVGDPENGTDAGLKYLKTLHDRYENELPETERNWFALASYNAGFERIQDARKFAVKLGYDPDQWFENVELAMQELSKPGNREHTRYGFCRCGQTVVYLRSIKKLYNSYIQLSDPLVVASEEPNLFTDNRLDPQPLLF